LRVDFVIWVLSDFGRIVSPGFDFIIGVDLIIELSFTSSFVTGLANAFRISSSDGISVEGAVALADFFSSTIRGLSAAGDEFVFAAGTCVLAGVAVGATFTAGVAVGGTPGDVVVFEARLATALLFGRLSVVDVPPHAATKADVETIIAKVEIFDIVKIGSQMLPTFDRITLLNYTYKFASNLELDAMAR